MNEVDISLTICQKAGKNNNSKITKIRRIYSKSGEKKQTKLFYQKDRGVSNSSGLSNEPGHW